jgi:hypothetical protein
VQELGDTWLVSYRTNDRSPDLEHESLVLNGTEARLFRLGAGGSGGASRRGIDWCKSSVTHGWRFLCGSVMPRFFSRYLFCLVSYRTNDRSPDLEHESLVLNGTEARLFRLRDLAWQWRS